MANVDYQEGVDAFLKKVAYEFQIDNEFFSVVLPSRLSSGSPISFIKKGYVNPNVIGEIDRSEYECEHSGINCNVVNHVGLFYLDRQRQDPAQNHLFL